MLHGRVRERDFITVRGRGKSGLGRLPVEEELAKDWGLEFQVSRPTVRLHGGKVLTSQ